MSNINKKKYLGDYLIEAGIINQNQLNEALDYQKKTLNQGNVGLLGQTLVELGYCTSEDIMLALAMKDGVPFMVLDQDKIDEEAINLLTHDIMERYMAIPVGFDNNRLLVAMLHPTDVIAIDDLRILTGYDIQPIIIPDFQLFGALEQSKSGILGKITFDFKDNETLKSLQDANGMQLYEAIEIEDPSMDEGFEVTDDVNTRPAVQLANTIFNQAVESRASDVHIEPYEKKTRIRFRIDGVLHEIMNPPKRIHPSLISRIKVMANMDIAERRIPQDGRITLILDSKTVDVRVASLPTAYGEKLTLRLLNRNEKLITIPELGFPDSQLDIFYRIMDLPYGFILVTGPTGSGKSTTLYAALSRLNSVDKNIITIEDPIERRIDGINQTQVNVRAGMTFASGLRSFLRND
ncbi:MAG TPA: ATPase, T2SS/T4P/T4SS family, partial [Clostridia bacterium]|nr:ATPase, T2SS/T4P/T4SS family [Clostridia bacterium]